MPTMSKAKRPPDPPADPPAFEVGQLLSARIDTGRLADALNRYYASMRPRPSKTSIVLTAVEDLVTRAGFLPLPEGQK
jgi:hypothetical protein